MTSQPDTTYGENAYRPAPGGILDLTASPASWINGPAAGQAGVALERLRQTQGVRPPELMTQQPGHLLASENPSSPLRPDLLESQLLTEAQRELNRSLRTRRPGLLALVTVVEWEQLHGRLGAAAEETLADALRTWIDQDSDALEQHSARSQGGGFLILLPEVDAPTGRERLAKLARRIAGSVIEVAGEQLRLTPVVGYAGFAGAQSGPELVKHAQAALEDARCHLDLLPVAYSSLTPPAEPAPQDRVLEAYDKARSPIQIAFTAALLLCLPFIVYVISSYAGFDLTSITYPLVAVSLAFTAFILWVECFRAAGTIDLPPEPSAGYPVATAVVAAYLPNEAATIVATIEQMLAQDYPGGLQVILAYNTPQPLPVELTLAALAAEDPRLLLLQVPASTSKAQNVNAALAHVRGEFVGVFDADHHPAPGSFVRAWRWLHAGHDIVQGHCVVRNGESSWVSRMVAVEFETIYAVNHPGRARLHGFGIFGGSNGYWRTSSLRQIRMHGAMLTEDIDSSMRSLLDGFSIVSDPDLLSTELAPVTLRSLWNQRMRWAQGWTQTAVRHLGPALRSPSLSPRQKAGAAFLLGWTQVVPWVTIQVVPILAFSVWEHGGFTGLHFFIPLFVLLTIFTFSVGIAQTVFAYFLSEPSIRAHKSWFFLYALQSLLWYGEFKNVISRVAQLKEFSGERHWRVTPRSEAPSEPVLTPDDLIAASPVLRVASEALIG